MFGHFAKSCPNLLRKSMDSQASRLNALGGESQLGGVMSLFSENAATNINHRRGAAPTAARPMVSSAAAQVAARAPETKAAKAVVTETAAAEKDDADSKPAADGKPNSTATTGTEVPAKQSTVETSTQDKDHKIELQTKNEQLQQREGELADMQAKLEELQLRAQEAGDDPVRGEQALRNNPRLSFNYKMAM
ncbi:hypothetical protein DOTSEDRAFT_25056 [Dothistroma septosporum NZE10]|uniref:Uncharacterized protein n=1 Tax=Dothistroma septosporum (strain NZE10 / CBS 128990) TaxID=675120 RepID=M2Y454_DOTSN|nr:hypothetical protein DOTSEDRAFT_25056 [Dothistroma septosporum NZE10]